MTAEYRAPTDGEVAEADDALVIRRVGHDLRNKLAVLQNSVYYLNMKLEPADPKVRKHLDILAREISQGNQIVMNLMDLLAPKAPERTAIEAADLLRRALERTPAPAGIETRLEAANAAPLWVDVDQALHALGNVLAYQFGTLESGGVVRLLAHGAGPVSLDLIDSGPGLTPAEKEALLDWQAVDGLAVLRMGLAAAERLAQVNGGRLQCESRPRVGTRFSLMFPTRPVPGA